MQAVCCVCNLSILWAKAGRLRVKGQFGLPKESLSQEKVDKFYKTVMAR